MNALDFDNILKLALATIAIALVKILASNVRKRKYPPGPRGFPLIGNVLDVPSEEPWVAYVNWKDVYGDVIHLDVLGTSIIILNNLDDCLNLLEKRSSIYSDRKNMTMGSTLMGWGKTVGFAPYGEIWRRYRRMCAQTMRKESIQQFRPIQEKGVVQYLDTLVNDPSNFKANFRFFASKMILWSMYGVEVKTPEDPIVKISEDAIHQVLFAILPGNFLVDFFPALRHLPKWFPGTGFKKFAEIGRQLAEEMVNLPFDVTLKDLKSGTPNSSFTALNLNRGEDEELVKWCTGTMFSAAIDTSVATIYMFFLTMTLHPESQKKAQAEIDAVCGHERLPNFGDRDNLPFVNALIKEVMRWQPVVPIAIPHRLMRDDVYKDMVLPGGSLVMGNTWAITRDPLLFENPESFIPERYLPTEGKEMPLDPSRFAFGYGRRICAGMHYADSMLFTAISRILATFTISPTLDEAGNEVLPELKFNSLFVREPLPFTCSIKPRPQTTALLATSKSESAALN